MNRVTVWMLAAGMLAGLLVGCKDKEKTEETVAVAPTQSEPVEQIPEFPEELVPPPDTPPAAATGSPSAEAYAPPVDTTATAAEKSPAATAQPLPKESYAPVEKKAPRIYAVRKGDTLQIISKRFYKTTRKWRAIYEANRDVLAKGPNFLQVGMKLKIP